ncbi:hypothetical protein GFB82_22110, partial [Acinetobacter baumannii]|nr:hypothetical protein [Acinetobacter baumannii]
MPFVICHCCLPAPDRRAHPAQHVLTPSPDSARNYRLIPALFLIVLGALFLLDN